MASCCPPLDLKELKMDLLSYQGSFLKFSKESIEFVYDGVEIGRNE